jgi:hypothetical protein
MPSFYYRTELAQLVVPGINQNLPEVNITFREVDNPTHVTMMSDRNFTDTIGFLGGRRGTRWTSGSGPSTTPGEPELRVDR